MEPGVPNARVEAADNRIKVARRMAYGFGNIDNLVSLIMLRCPDLPVEPPARVLPLDA